jgi:predicted NAD/FAD-binding protein
MHPLYTATSVDTHALLPLIQNRRGIAWAGAWCGYGFHEDGLTAGLRAAQALDPSCLPEWADLDTTPSKAGLGRLEPAVETP